jgi:YbbR domain-containing protein
MDQKNTWLVKFLSVIAAFSLWLYISNINDNQRPQTITVPVEIINMDAVTEKNLILLPNQKLSVELNVRGTPTDISNGEDDFRVLVDFSLYGLSKGELRLPVIIDKQPVNVTVLNSEVYFVKVQFDDLLRKTVPVKVSLGGKIKDGYYAMPQNVSPTDVVVSGAARYVTQVVAVEARGDLKSSDKNLKLSLPLKPVDATGKEVINVELNSENVTVDIPIKKTKTVSINVVTKGNISKDMFLRTLVLTPEIVDIAGEEEVINSIVSLDTETIDLSTISPKNNIVAKIIVPEGVSFINSDGTVRIKATMEKIVQKSITVDIGIKNLNDTFTAVLDNPKAVVVVAGPESTINALKPTELSCVVDLGGITAEGDHSIQIDTTLPEDISKISITPQNAKVTVKKKVSG